MAYQEMRVKTEAGKCFLCEDAPCSKACTCGLPVSDIIRSIRFENPLGAAKKLKGENVRCSFCPAPCMQACTRGKVADAIRIPELVHYAKGLKSGLKPLEDVDLSIDFCGVHFENPFLPIKSSHFSLKIKDSQRYTSIE